MDASARTLITDTGNKLWMEAFGKPPEQTEMPAESKRLLEQALIFKHRPEIGRVIFMSTPHRGSDLAKQLDRPDRIDAGENAESSC